VTDSDAPKIQGWSRIGARCLGRSRRDYAPDEPCYYYTVPGCTDCGPPPALLTGSGIIPS